MSELTVELGRVIRKKRLGLGLSQEGFAARIGVHRTYVGGVERGERNVTLLTLQAFAEGLNASVAALIAEAEGQRPIAASNSDVDV